jgi:hypothetical protein
MSDVGFLARQFAINLLVCVVMTIVMTTLIFHGRDAVPLWGVGNLAFDLIPSTVLPTLAATLAISKVTRLALAQGALRPVRGRLHAWLPQGDALAGLVLGCALLAVLGAGFLATLSFGYDRQPVAFAAIIVAKLVYAVVLCLANTPIIVARARARSWRGAHDDQAV